MVLHFKQSWIVLELLRRVDGYAVLVLYLLLEARVMDAGHLVTHNTHKQHVM